MCTGRTKHVQAVNLSQVERSTPAIERLPMSTFLDRIRDVVSFKPTESQRRARSNFWTAVEIEGLEFSSTADVTLPAALKYGQDRRLTGWWDDQQFRDWFSNGAEFKQRADLLSHLAMDELEELIRDRSAPASSRVQAIKMAMEISGKLGKAVQTPAGGMLDERVSTMDRTELEKFIQSKLIKLTPGTDDN